MRPIAGAGAAGAAAAADDDGDNDEAAKVHGKVGDDGGPHCHDAKKELKKNFWAFFMHQTAAAAKAEQYQGEVWGGGRGGQGREREEKEGEP